MKTKLISSRNPFCIAIFVAAATCPEIYAQNTYTFAGVNGASWIRSSNWTGGTSNKSPGVDAESRNSVDGLTNDIAAINTSSSITTLGINMNASANTGITSNGGANQSLTLGAITLTTGGTAGSFTISNNSGTLDGVLTLTGPTVGLDSNVILKNSSASSLTLANGSAKSLGVALGNATDNAVIITGAGNIVISSVVSGSSSNLTLSASSTGSLILGGVNTYGGTTTINSGILSVTGSLASGSAVTVKNTGTLAGSGTVSGTVAVNNGGILGAGNAAIGTLTTGAATFDNASIFSWDIAVAGATYDKLIAPSLTDGGTAGGSVFRIVAADTTFANAFWNTSQTFNDIFTTNGATAIASWASIFNTVTVVDGTFTPVDVSVRGSFSTSGNTLTWTPVPEPSSAFAGLLIGAGLLRRRRSA